jgi:hypothetical protein
MADMDEFVEADEEDLVEATTISTILEYCGFTNAGDRTNIAQDGFESFDDILTLSEKDIGSLSKGFSERTVANGRINFGLRRTNYLKATIHWTQDFRRISREPTLDGIENINDFKDAIEQARQRAQMRKHTSEESESLIKSSDPGKLKKNKEWLQWSRSLKNYLSTILGQDGVPLSYVIRENEDPDYEGEDDDDYDFEQLSIKCAPLSGLIYKTDARKVHQLIHGFVQGEAAETWIKPRERRQDGRTDFKALQAHYGGEGSKSVRIKEADILRNTLQYKSERAMSFEKFLTNMQAMFTGFNDNGEFMDEPQKIRLLFQKVQSPALTQVKNALQVQYDLDRDENVTFDFIANSLAKEAASLPEFNPNRQASAVDSRSGVPESGIRGPDGVIFTGFYKNFQQLSENDKQAIYDERKRLNIVPKKSRSERTKKRTTSAIKSKKKTLVMMNREISSLKARLKDMEGKKTTSSGDEDDAPQDNAGDQFGGRKQKKQKKEGG